MAKSILSGIAVNGIILAGAGALLAGCAGGPTGGDPGARALPPGTSCQSIRGELNKLDSRGVPSRVEAAQAGKKLSAQQQSEVDLYNKLLADYLGARCHVAPPH